MSVHCKLNAGQGFPWRLMTGSTVFNGEPLAIGCNHASWFLVFAYPEAITLKRAALCLNFIVGGDPSTLSSPPIAAGSKPRFTIGGSQGLEVLDILSALRDRVTASVVVRSISPSVMRKKAQCHFKRVLRCKRRYYCSAECQKADWFTVYHKAECSLLQAGKAWQAERRRKLHDNALESLGCRKLNLNELSEEQRHDMLTFARRTAPRDVSKLSSNVSLYKSPIENVSGHNPCVMGRPHTSVPKTRRLEGDEEGDAPSRGQPLREPPEPEEAADSAQIHSPLMHDDNAMVLDDLPELPLLPDVPGWIPTGDPIVDEALLWDHVKKTGNTQELINLNRLFQARGEVLFARRQLALRRASEMASLFKETLGGRMGLDGGSEAGSVTDSMSSLALWSDTESWFSDDELNDKSEGDTCEDGQVESVQSGR
ncbi:hypothetical protein BN946_scf184747.g35 [Trametes cinnabarina]|uniref:MYND-type domain-containing protein n=1 Tax=Pycnoporus cinnabarinus TaxID=5643 RepID=A0A060SRQ2_PYCCI|nr:hypothetical protein BN946_scf184747.g35 [Trametes cinnabarina]